MIRGEAVYSTSPLASRGRSPSVPIACRIRKRFTGGNSLTIDDATTSRADYWPCRSIHGRTTSNRNVNHPISAHNSHDPLSRILMRRKGEGWQQDLLAVLDEMAALYEAAPTAAVMSRP